jgi:anti-sigma B factor antagonist
MHALPSKFGKGLRKNNRRNGISLALSWQSIGGVDRGNEMKAVAFLKWRKHDGTEGTRLHAGEIAVHVLTAVEPLAVTVAGRMTVDSSPNLRTILLKLLCRGATPVMVIDLSAVSYLDMSGLATLLEVLKHARQRSVRLRVTGLSGEARTLAEVAQLDTIFRAWGSEVEFR